MPRGRRCSGPDSDGLLRFLSAIFDSLDINRLQSNYLSVVPNLVSASAYGFYLLDVKTGQPTRIATNGATDRFLIRYEEAGRSRDPFLKHIVQTHEPVHTDLLFTQSEFQRHPLYCEVMATEGLACSLQAPLVLQGQLVGTLNFARTAEQPRFDDADVRILRIVARHTSVALAHAVKYAEARERYTVAEATLQLIGPAVVVSDNDGGIRFANLQAQELLNRNGPALENHIQNGLLANISKLERSGSSVATRALIHPHGSGNSTLIIRSARVPAAKNAVANFLYSGGLCSDFRHMSPLLSKREIEVLELIAQGFKNKQIADILVISTNTVKTHLKQMFCKMQVSSRSQLLTKVFSSSPGNQRSEDTT